MKRNQISDLPKIPLDFFENALSVYTDADGRYFYNLIQSIEFPSDLPAGLYTDYAVVPGDTWPLVSYKHYKTTSLWWLILLANGIDNPTNQPTSGDVLRIPTTQVASQVVQQINRS